VRDLRGVLDREKAAMGVLNSLKPPTCNMVAGAVSSGFYEHKTIRELTHCTTAIYVLLSAPATRSLRAFASLLSTPFPLVSSLGLAQFERKPGRTGEREERQSPVTATPRPP
jgi:hypothetical protein